MLTQKQLIIEYIRENGSILPAKLGGRPYLNGFFGSEISKRCRELWKKGILVKEREGKFERFYPSRTHTIWNTIPEKPKVVKKQIAMV